MNRSTPKGALLGAAIAAASLGLPACSSRRAAEGGASIGPPDVPLVTHRGEKIRFRERIRGEVVLVNFMYTKCNGSCPGTTHNLLKVQEALGEHLGRDVFMYSVSLDPKVDTPEVLDRYATAIGAKPGWTFLTGERRAIDRLRKMFGVYSKDPASDANKITHANMLMYGNEATGAWATLPGIARPDMIVQAVLRLLRRPVARAEEPEQAPL
jgi:protein SCO1/2